MTILKKETKDNNRVELTIRVLCLVCFFSMVMGYPPNL